MRVWSVMRGWVVVALSIALWLSSTAGAPAQVDSARPAATTVATPVLGIIERGVELERNRRWGEALTLYEEALRDNPRDAHLEQRFSLARVHYDLSRRYNDHTFTGAVSSLGVNAALELYSEVLLKVQSHYVDTPDFARLVEQGTVDFEAALGDPVFIEHHLPSAESARIEHFRRNIRAQIAEHVGPQGIGTRLAARDAVEWVAQTAEQELGLTPAATVMEYLCGATNLMDPYSTFLTPGQLTEVYSQIEGNFVGLGIELKARDGALMIVKVITGSPAERAGLRANDRIVAVDGKPTTQMSTDQAANLLQGAEGSVAQVRVLSPGKAPRDLRIRREQVDVPSVDDVKMVDQAAGIGYLKITCFQKTTSRDLDNALWKLHRQGMKSLILDLRGNPGGLLTTSVDVVDRFVDQGTIVSTRGRATHEDYNYTAHQTGTWRVPLVVLIDGESASASEIFAGAIRDHRRGTIVGSRSYGKGSVQGIFPLNGLSAGLRLTTAKFYSPHGHPFSQVGVEPDVRVQKTAKPVDDQIAVVAGDPAMDAALGVARRSFAKR